MRRLLQRFADEESGIALVAAILLVGLLSTVAVGLMSLTQSEGTASVADVQTNNALQAAQDGLNVYIADLTEDTGFYLDYIAEGEARRTYGGTQYPTTAGANATANVALSPSWPRTATWTYPSDITTDPGWRTISGTNYQYLLEVFPDTTTFNDVRVIAVGRPVPSTQYPASNKAYYRAVESELSVLTISDFQMLSAGENTSNNIGYGSGATTNGWVYATDDDNGTPASISGPASGTAWTTSADLFTENNSASYTGKITLTNNSREYSSNSSPSIRTVISEPITFNDIQESQQISPVGGGEGAIELDAASNGITLAPTTNIPDAWWLKFQSNGTVQIYSCVRAYTGTTTKTYYSVTSTSPTCTLYATDTLSQTGEEIYSTEDVIVSGVVNGQVTIYTAGGGTAADGYQSTGNIIIGGALSYQTAGQDVLGLIAQQNVIIACWQGQTNLSWQAATIALNGVWESDQTYEGSKCSSSYTSMTFTGSSATYGGGGMGGYSTRTYNYDPTLRYLPPPDYPQIPAALKVMYERQVASP
jgi:hypothetical protein